MAKITFSCEIAISFFHSMCEGMAEIAQDNGIADPDEIGRAALLEELIGVTGADVKGYPHSATLNALLTEQAQAVLENVMVDGDDLPNVLAQELLDQSIIIEEG